ncbi:unnamed protein product [Closterium sp. NIES-64]|nr:unnamed protein product [Closterium sp. NIES-64]
MAVAAASASDAQPLTADATAADGPAEGAHSPGARERSNAEGEVKDVASAAAFPARSPAPGISYSSSHLQSSTPSYRLQSFIPAAGAESSAAASGTLQGMCGLSGEHALRSALVSAIVSKIEQMGRAVSARLAPVAPASAVLAGDVARGFATAAPAEEDVVKAAFIKQQASFRSYLEGLKKVSIPMDAADDKATKAYAAAVKNIRESLGIPSFSEKLSNLLESAEEDSRDVRSFLEESRIIRRQLGVEDKLGAEKLMFAALDSVEKKLGKALVGDDVKGMAMFQEEVNAINKKLGLKDGDLEPLEQQLETSMAKTDIAAFASEATQKIGTYQKRDGLEDIQVDLKTLDPKAYICEGGDDDPWSFGTDDDVPLLKRRLRHRLQSKSKRARVVLSDDDGPEEERRPILTAAEKGKAKVAEAPAKAPAKAPARRRTSNKKLTSGGDPGSSKGAAKKKAKKALNPDDIVVNEPLGSDDEYAAAAGPIPTFPEKVAAPEGAATGDGKRGGGGARAPGDNTRLLGRALEEEEEEAMQAEGVREVAVATGLEVLYQETPNYRGAAAKADRMIKPRETARHAWRVPDLGVEPDVSAGEEAVTEGG